MYFGSGFVSEYKMEIQKSKKSRNQKRDSNFPGSNSASYIIKRQDFVQTIVF